MARKTKEDALATRALILDAAERVFHLRGVSRTSLQEIAKDAGLTRGAIYWHFENKGELFHAMMERVTLPMMARMTEVTPGDEDQPLEKIRRNTASALRQVVHDPQVRRVFEIAMDLHKQGETEYAICIVQQTMLKRGDDLTITPAFKTLVDKDLVYEGKRVILYCPRCATPLSNFEIAMDNSYKDREDDSVYVKFELRDHPGDAQEGHPGEGHRAAQGQGEPRRGGGRRREARQADIVSAGREAQARRQAARRDAVAAAIRVHRRRERQLRRKGG